MSEQTKKIIKKKITLETLADTVATLASTVTNGFAQTKQDNNDLAVNMDHGFAKANTRMNEGFLRAKRDNDDLTMRMDEGFAGAHERMDQGFAKAHSIMDEGFATAKKNNDNLRKETKKDNEDLALMVSNGFEEVNGKFEEMRQESGKRFTSIESGLGDVQSKLANVAYNIDLQRVEKRVQHLEDIVLARRKK